MPDVAALIDQVLTQQTVGQQKQAAVMQASQQKQAELGGVDPRLALAQDAVAGTEGNKDRYAYRSLGQATGDFGMGTAQGFLGGALGIGAFGAGIVNPNAGVWLSDRNRDLTNFIQDKESAGLFVRRRYNQALNAADIAANAREYEQDVGKDGQFLAGLKRIGRDSLDTVKNSFDDPAVISDGLANMTGSLLLAGPVTKGVTAGGNILARNLAVGATGPSAAAAMIANATTKAATPIAIGAMEAGGAYDQTVQDVMAMTPEQLSATSEPYRELVGSGMSPEQAQIELANRAGVKAGGIQAPIGAATGMLVSKFEANPFKVRSLKASAGDALREGTEEGIQGATGQLAENYAVQTEVDNTRDLTDGVGESAATGVMYGLGSAPVTAGPGLAAKAIADTVGAGVNAVGAGVGAVAAAGDQKIAAVNNAVDERNRVTEQALLTSAQATQDSLKEAINTQDQPAEAKAQQTDYVDRLFSNMTFDPAETTNEAPIVQQATQGATDRFTALRGVISAIVDPKTSDEDKLAATAYLTKQSEQFQSLLEGDLSAAIDQVDNSDPNLPKLRDFEALVTILQRHPQTQAALRKGALAASSKAVAAQLEDPLTAQRTAEDIISIVGSDPDNADTKVLDTIRAHSVSGKIQLTPAQKGILNTAYSLIKDTQDFQEQKKKLGLSYSDKVTQEVLSRDEGDDVSEIVRKSAREHAKGILAAYVSNKPDLARSRLQDFMLFAEHMQNKVTALNASEGTGQNVPYKALSSKRSSGQPVWYSAKSGLGLMPDKVGSVRFAQQTALDAMSIAKFANGVVEAFPDLGIKPVVPVTLNIDPKLEKKASDIVSDYAKQSKKTNKVEETKPVEPVQAKQEEVKAATEIDPNQQPLPFEKPVEPLKEAQQPKLPLEAKAEVAPQAKTEAEAETKTDPIPEPTPEPVVSEPAKAEPYSNLVGSSEKTNWFKKAFRIPEVAKSRLAGMGEAVFDNIKAALSSTDAFKAMAGGKFKLTDKLIPAYKSVLGQAENIQEFVEAELQRFLDKAVKEGKLSDLLGTEDGPQNWRTGKTLNLVEKTEDGSYRYSPELLQSAVLAGLQWVVATQGGRQKNMTAEEIAEVLNIEETDVTPEMEASFNNNTTVEEAKRNLARMITRFWGVESNENVAEGFVRGIPEAMAAELIAAMSSDEVGILELTKETVVTSQDAETKFATFQWVRARQGKGVQDTLKTLSVFPDAIERLAVIEPELVRFIGAAPTEVARYQLRNRMVKNTPNQRAMIERAQNTPYKANAQMVAFYKALGPDLFLDLFGEGKLNENLLNRNHMRSLNGRNAGVRGAYESLMSTMGQIEGLAAETGTDPHEISVYYRFMITKVGRLMMQGTQNPQANKAVREALLSTRVTLDMSDVKNQEKFLLAVAQAWGIKVHKQSRSASAADARRLAQDPKIAAALKVLSNFQFEGKKITSEDVVTLKTAFGKDFSPAAVHAAMEYARLERTKPKEKTEFVTDLYVEADGMTDGPINALYHLATGAFTRKWVELMAKGGLYLGKRGMTANEFIENGTTDQKKDLYEITSDALQAILVRNRLDMNPAVQKQATKVNRLIELLLPDATLDQDNNLVLKRGIVKNPLTVTVYGAGKQGITNKIVGMLTKAFYEELSKAAAEQPNNIDEIGALVEELSATYVNMKDGYVGRPKKAVKPPAKNTYQDYTLTPEQMGNLSQNIQALFVNPMSEAINGMMSDTQEGRQVLQKATQVQSIFAEYTFIQLVQEKLASKPEKERSAFLSQAELAQINKELLRRFPLVSTEQQAFFVSKSRAANIFNKDDGTSYFEFSRTMREKLSSRAYAYGPSDVGVGGIPDVVQGFGDGLMIQNLLTMEDGPEGILPVYDGVHTKLDTLDEDGVKINQAVYQAWQNNPLSAVNESFQTFLSKASFENMPENMREALSKAFGEFEAIMPASDLRLHIELLGKSMGEAADLSLARHRALSRFEMTVDHMSSIGASYQAEGEGLQALEGSDAEIAAQLDQAMAEELHKIRKTKAVETDVGALVVTPASRLLKLVSGLGVSPEQKNLLQEIAIALQKSGWEVVQGSQEQAAAYAQEKGFTPYPGHPGEVLKGYVALGQKRIYLHTTEAETLLHEMLHASVSEKILDHYKGSSSPATQEVVRNLESLLEDWLSREGSISSLSAEEARSYRNALNQVRNEANNPDRSAAENKAAALDEFLAWNLSNQDLIKVAKGVQVEKPFMQIVEKAIRAIKYLIWGSKISPNAKWSMYESLRFNSSVLINHKSKHTYDTYRFMSVAYGNSDRLDKIQRDIQAKIKNLLDELPDGATRLAEKRKIRTILANDANRVRDAFERAGFAMTFQEKAVFNNLLTVLSTKAALDPASLARIQELYSHVNKKLEFEDFLTNRTTSDPNLITEANRKLAALKGFDQATGRPFLRTDSEGRSTLMSSFLALAMVNDEFREILAKMDIPKTEKLKNDTLDNVATNVGNTLLEELSVQISGEGRNAPNIQEALDRLTERMVLNTQEQENTISHLAGVVTRGIDGMNDKIVDVMQTTSRKTIEKVTEAQDATNSKVAKGLLEVVKGVASIVNEQEARVLAEGWISTANRLKIYTPMREFLNELVGRTESNAPVYDLIKRVRSVVQQMRQQFREYLPGLIEQKFSVSPTKSQWTDMFNGMGKTDLAALHDGNTVTDILEMLKDPAKQSREKLRLEDLIQQEAGPINWPLLQAKAKQLATYMNTGVTGAHLLRNAQAVSGLYGVQGAVNASPRPNMVRRVDKLISLYALEAVDQSVKDTLSSMAENEASGMEFVLSYLVGQRKAEQDKVLSGKAKANHYKGYIPSEAQPGAQLKIAEDTEAGRLRILGYKQIAPYAGSSHEFGSDRKSYFFAPVSSRALFNQGNMQNVRQTASGVDPVTGHSHGPMTAGRIVDPRAVRRIARLNGRREVGENLMPIFDDVGEVIAYERSIDPVQQKLLNPDTHLARMIGVWRGRQEEESTAGQFNKVLVKNLKHIWDQEKGERADEFINLFDVAEQRKDPVMADAVSLFTPEALAHIQDTFEGEGFMVRRDMINDAIGYRSASIGDVWTGTTRLPPEVADVSKRLVIGVFGLDAYQTLVTAEKVTQNLVSEARKIIVVKSVIVPAANFIANIYQLTSRGVGLARMTRDMPKKLAETNAYVIRRHRQIELEADLRAAENDIRAVRKIQAELQSIHDANLRMSIWPLIEAGEFSSISQAGNLQREDTTLFEGKLSEYIESKVNKLPKGIRDVGRYGLVTQDTALFQGMRKAMEYGDFLAKAIHYDHLVQEKKVPSKDAIAKISEEYVNYDRLSGRMRTYMENIGLLWFWNFKVRITKIAIATIRENPLHALLTSLVPTPDLVGTIGTPLEDNLLSMWAMGDLGWSVGPGMGLRSYEMMPWINLTS